MYRLNTKIRRRVQIGGELQLCVSFTSAAYSPTRACSPPESLESSRCCPDNSFSDLSVRNQLAGSWDRPTHCCSEMWAIGVVSLWMLLLGIPVALYFYLRRQFSFWSDRNAPYKEAHWIFGNLAEFVRGKRSLAEVSLDLYKEFKGSRFVGIWEFHSPTLFVIDPELLRDILVKDFASWSTRGTAANVDVDPLSANLIHLNGDTWKSVRAKLTPTFTSGKLKQMHYLLLECGKDFEKYLNAAATDGKPLEAREMSAKFTTDVIGSCAFGIQMNSLNDEDAVFRRMGRKIFEPSTKGKIVRALQRHFPGLFKFLNLSTHEQELTDFFLKITKENLEYRERNNLQRHDFMDLLRNMKNSGEPLGKDDVEIDYRFLAAQAFVFFAAGFETSSTAISFCLHELAVNQDIQDRLRDEINETKAASDGEVTWDGLNSMKYLDMVVAETLRKYPPIPVTTRCAVKPYRIPGTDIELPERTGCIAPIYALHHDPEYYPEPDKFIPERFTDEAKSQRPALAYLPFGSGPRVCIGLRFAEQQTKLGLVKLVENFKITLCEKSQNPLQLDPKARFLVAKGGIWIRISKNS
ncbi:probable cytochrome P450 6a13 [Neodiprion pinetum]|uniref:probable cytochrome P450 6a13 n=1 Tax=Neodiprion pinetum TaxID=441929 RepID=UPI001EDF0F5D|nr:probable cytochrome P450 6a13 [Neodiprion pinetum]XP_046482184.1 probable cytochrome P450 6a13 [Neodiprion pinetum]